MNETELERMVVRLVGDGSSYQRMMTDAATHSEQAAKSAESAGKKIEQIREQMEGFGKAALGALSAFGLVSSLEGAFHKFEEFEHTQIRMNAIIEASHLPLEKTKQHYKELTQQIMDHSLASKGEINNLILQGLNMNKSGDTLDRMVKNSVAFGAATGKSAEEGFQLAKALEMGNTHMLKHMLLGRGATATDAELAVIVKERLAAGLKIAEEMANTAGGRIEKLGRSFKGLSIEIGGMVAQALQPAVTAVEWLIKKFNMLSPAVKQNTALVIGLTLAFAAIPPILATVALIWHSMTGGVFVVMGLITSIVAYLAYMGSTTKGVGSAWEYVKKKATEAWEWLMPVRQAVMSFWNSIVEVATSTWDWIKKIALDAWNSISINAGIDWNRIRDFISDAFIQAEFAVRNFGRYWDLIVVGAKYKWTEFVNSVTWFFKEDAPVLINWFKEAFLLAIKVLVAALPDLAYVLKLSMAGEFQLASTLATAAAAGINKELKTQIKPPDLKPRITPPDEAILREQFKALEGKIAMDFQAFRAMKLAEFANAATLDKAEKDGELTSEAFKNGLGKGIKDHGEAVLRGSAEALRRIFSSREHLADMLKTGKGAAASSGTPAVAQANQPVLFQPAVQINQPPTKAEGLLGQILIVLTAIMQKKVVDIQPANVGHV